jgi:hypothetical protein
VTRVPVPKRCRASSESRETVFASKELILE